MLEGFFDLFAVRNDVFYVHARIPPNTSIFNELTKAAAAFLSHVYNASPEDAEGIIMSDPYCPLCVRNLATKRELNSALGSSCFSAHVAALVSRRLVPIALAANALEPSMDVRRGTDLWPLFSGPAAALLPTVVVSSPRGDGVGKEVVEEVGAMGEDGPRACEKCAPFTLGPEELQDLGNWEKEVTQSDVDVAAVTASLASVGLSSTGTGTPKVDTPVHTGEASSAHPGSKESEDSSALLQLSAVWTLVSGLEDRIRLAVGCSEFQRDADCCIPDFDDMNAAESGLGAEFDQSRANSRKRHPTLMDTFVQQRCLVRGFFPAHLGRDGLGGARQNMHRDKHPFRRHE